MYVVLGGGVAWHHTPKLMPIAGEKNAKSKEMIRTKTAEYMDRAEKLKNHLAEQDDPNRKKPSAVGSNGKVSNGGGKKYATLPPCFALRPSAVC
jgi:hypothetical protein